MYARIYIIKIMIIIMYKKKERESSYFMYINKIINKL
jgi:hypothetical protein